jgi:hypothetical protein
MGTISLASGCGRGKTPQIQKWRVWRVWKEIVDLLQREVI